MELYPQGSKSLKALHSASLDAQSLRGRLDSVRPPGSGFLCSGKSSGATPAPPCLSCFFPRSLIPTNQNKLIIFFLGGKATSSMESVKGLYCGLLALGPGQGQTWKSPDASSIHLPGEWRMKQPQLLSLIPWACWGAIFQKST